MKFLTPFFILSALMLTVSAYPVDSKSSSTVKSSAVSSVTSSVKSSVSTTNALVDINSATKDELMKLPGIGTAYAERIIRNRPYARKDQLVSKRVIPEAIYRKIAALIVAKQPSK